MICAGRSLPRHRDLRLLPILNNSVTDALFLRPDTGTGDQLCVWQGYRLELPHVAEYPYVWLRGTSGERGSARTGCLSGVSGQAGSRDLQRTWQIATQ
jgi:hypothetical protein